jgi:hypothetical protein
LPGQWVDAGNFDVIAADLGGDDRILPVPFSFARALNGKAKRRHRPVDGVPDAMKKKKWHGL